MILLKGYVSNNLGDDLFFEYVSQRYPNTKFYLRGSKKYNNSFLSCANLEMINPSFVKILYNKLLRKMRGKYIDIYTHPKNIETCLTIGGSIFMQNLYWESELSIFAKQLQRYDTNIILGCNFGPFNSEEYINQYSDLFEQVDDICFRDKYSYNLFKKSTKVRYAPDILFGLNPIKASTEKTILISVIKPSIRKNLMKFDELYYEGIYSFAKKYLKENYQIQLVSFCKNEGDEEAVENIFGRFSSNEQRSIKKVFYDGTNREGILNLIAESEIIVATRFHAMILGWVHNKKVLPIIYSDKTLNVIKDLSFNGRYVDLRERKTNYDISLSEIGKLENIDEIINESYKHFKVLDKYLK
ncbi:MAG: polysaccharide pyruvyl transferase family protein [Caryophanon sp.]|nr:polysaccharide pyruvyl transferase family protein [Caryophanon sp.]